MIALNRRSFAISVLGGLSVAGGLQKSHAAADVSHPLEGMVAALQGQSTISFSADMEFGASAGSTGRRSLGPSVHLVFERAGRLLASYGGPLDLHLLIASGEAMLYRPSKGLKSVLKPVTGGSAFAVPGLFLPYLGLFDTNLKKALFGEIQSVTPLAQGTPEQPEETDLMVVMSTLFTGEIWIRKSDSTPARLIGTFFDGAGGVAESASLTFSNWSSGPVASDTFDIPGLSKAKEVYLDKIGF
jgi:hypothetical protein